ncbi:hypothetical protein AB0F30_33265 [Streptomyces sp. NPDC029006]|uniref:hypothetical protein n=1 Tax=Streptomyces sp. NPDC029006 TaxID=3155467 RepID=UPI0033E17752
MPDAPNGGIWLNGTHLDASGGIDVYGGQWTTFNPIISNTGGATTSTKVGYYHLWGDEVEFVAYLLLTRTSAWCRSGSAPPAGAGLVKGGDLIGGRLARRRAERGHRPREGFRRWGGRTHRARTGKRRHDLKPMSLLRLAG